MSTLTEADVEAALSWLLSLPFDGYSVSRYYQLHGLFNVPGTHPRTPPTRRAPHADVLAGVSHQRIRWRSRERAKLQRQRRKAANAAIRQKA